VVAVFAICSAICVRILAYAYFDARDSKTLDSALLVAENGAECFKAAGDIQSVSEMLGGIVSYEGGTGVVTVYYDDQWQVCAENNAHYFFKLAYRIPESPSLTLLSGEISVEILNGERLIFFPVIRGTWRDSR